MPFDITNFRSSLMSRELSKPSKFMVRLFLPRGMAVSQDLAEMVRDMELWCEASSLPMSGLNTRDGWRYGYGASEKRVTGPGYQDIQLTLIADADGLVYRFFKEWMLLITNTDVSDSMSGTTGQGGAQPYELAYKTDYVTDLSIIICREVAGEEIMHVKLRDAFPLGIGEVKLDWSENNTYMRIPVMITYTDWFEEPPL